MACSTEANGSHSLATLRRTCSCAVGGIIRTKHRKLNTMETLEQITIVSELIHKSRQPYIETDCTFTAEGRSYTSGGAFVSPERIIAYPKENGVLGDWHGNAIGTWKAVSTWKTPRSYMSSTMSQIEAVVNGIKYTGRGCGIGMLYRGKRVA